MVICLLIPSLVISIDCLGGHVHAGRLCIRPSTADWHCEFWFSHFLYLGLI